MSGVGYKHTNADGVSPREAGSQVLGGLLHAIAFRLQKPLHAGVVAEPLL